MKPALQLQDLLRTSDQARVDPLTVFAFVILGVIESLTNGLMSPKESVRFVFHFDNCSYVRKRLKKKSANEVMGRGLQLADLFDGLPLEEAQREYARELAAMKALCMNLIEKEHLVA